MTIAAHSIGFIPVIGPTVVPVLLTLVTTWFLAAALVAVPGDEQEMVNINDRGTSSTLSRSRHQRTQLT